MSLKYSARHIRRAPYQTISALLIMVITFFMVTIFIMVGFISGSILKHFETKPQVSVFYPNDTPESEILDIKKQLETTGRTKEVRYISSKEAVEIYKKEAKIDEEDPNLDLISDKILPPSLEITSWSIPDLSYIKSVVEQKEGVKVVFIEEVVNRLSSWLNGLRTGGVILLSLLIIESTLVIWTIIGMRISQRKNEVEIMRLLGATNWYIRSPFIFEGIMYGVVGSIVGVVIAWALIQNQLNSLISFLSGIPILPLNATNFVTMSLMNLGVISTTAQTALDGIPLSPVSADFILVLIAIEMVIGMIIGAIGSYFAVVRSLKRY